MRLIAYRGCTKFGALFACAFRTTNQRGASRVNVAPKSSTAAPSAPSRPSITRARSASACNRPMNYNPSITQRAIVQVHRSLSRDHDAAPGQHAEQHIEPARSGGGLAFSHALHAGSAAARQIASTSSRTSKAGTAADAPAVALARDQSGESVERDQTSTLAAR
jgi:hypothetical protein